LPCVRVDSEAAATDAINYLIEQGHERIGMIRGDATSLITRDRERGYRSAMKQANLPVREEWIVEGKLSIPGARRASRTILACEEPPTAIFCANDDMAIGCLHEIKAAGLQVPRDVSVIGFDDIRYAEVTDPPLTTISQPAEEIGERVTDRLCRRIEGGSNGDAETQLLPHKLIIRQSVAPPDTQ
jgi:LacI family repressor for deo operon, udp, cdd, tsx, nupC, and nupG